VTGIEDEVLDLDALGVGADEDGTDHLSGLTGEGALLAALAAGRTGRMGDIVATIQAEQDAIIRADLAGALVVQGGPGTGKTAVALHRAAYLLYSHRRLLERSGVLLIGPSRVFLRYIDQVLPSLGETGVVTTTISELYPRLSATGVEDEAIAELKGRQLFGEVIARAVRQRQRVPAASKELRIDGNTLVITPRDVSEAIARARRNHRPHNLARITFVRDMLSRLAEQYVEQLGYPLAADERGDVLEELRADRDVRIALNLAWMPLTPQKLIEDLFSKPARLAAAAPGLGAADRALLYREAGAPWTPADVPLLDEAAELLGEDDQAARAQARTDAANRTAELEYARRVLQSSGNEGLVSAELLADRFASTGPRLTTAERAAADRTWTYAHVVVDEAQELSAMAWRMLLRRVPTRSMTIVGDVAQTSTRAGAHSWPAMLDPLLRTSWRLTELTVNYRTPSSVADAAQRVAIAAGLPVSSLTSAREVDDALVVEQVPDAGALAAGAARHARAALRRLHAGAEGGRVAVIVPGDLLPAVRAALSDEGLDDALGSGVSALDAPLILLRPREAKGLEFDIVVLVEPAEVGAASTGDLYVAMTRPTQQLRVVHHAELAPGFAPEPSAR
jgi:DNA helicase IV